MNTSSVIAIIALVLFALFIVLLYAYIRRSDEREALHRDEVLKFFALHEPNNTITANHTSNTGTLLAEKQQNSGSELAQLISATQREQKEYQDAHGCAALHARAPSAIPGDIFDLPPAVSERSQSTQYEHIHNMFLTDYSFVDYKRRYPELPLTNTELIEQTPHAYVTASNQYLIDLRQYFHSKFAEAAKTNNIPEFAWSGVFLRAWELNQKFMKNHFDRQETLKPKLLQHYFMSISDNLFDDLAHLFNTYKLKITPTGGIKQQYHPFEEKQVNTRPGSLEHSDDPSSLAMIDDNAQPSSSSSSLVALGNVETLNTEQMKQISLNLINDTFSTLLTKYEHLISHMNRSLFLEQSTQVINNAKVAVHDFFLRNSSPSQQDFDQLTDNIPQIMSDDLIDLLARNGVDVHQYDD